MNLRVRRFFVWCGLRPRNQSQALQANQEELIPLLWRDGVLCDSNLYFRVQVLRKLKEADELLRKRTQLRLFVKSDDREIGWMSGAGVVVWICNDEGVPLDHRVSYQKRLKNVMCEVGFAPSDTFSGFSYGDVSWSNYYDLPPLYGLVQVPDQVVL